MDAKTLFDQKLPEMLKAHPDKARELDAVYTFKISGEAGGTWTVDLKADPPTVSAGESGTADCTIEVSDEDFATMLSDPNAGMQLYFTGKLKVSGNPMLATKLQQLFSL